MSSSLFSTPFRYNRDVAAQTKRAERTNQGIPRSGVWAAYFGWCRQAITLVDACRPRSIEAHLGFFMNPRFSPVLFGLIALLFSGCAVPRLFSQAYLIIWKVSPAQQAAAEKEVQRYTKAVQKKERSPAKHRYIAVRTLDPNQKQRAAYLKKREAEKRRAESEHLSLSPHWVGPDRLHCVMVFDTRAKQFVGSGCYVVGRLPAEGEVAKFQTYNAEYVSSGTAQF